MASHGLRSHLIIGDLNPSIWGGGNDLNWLGGALEVGARDLFNSHLPMTGEGSALDRVSRVPGANIPMDVSLADS